MAIKVSGTEVIDNSRNIVNINNVDGRDVSADGTKLDTIETNADVTDTANVAAAGALMKSGGTMTGDLILNADPTTALGAATKEYVDTIAAAGIHYHAPVRVEAPANLNANYDNGASGVGATLTNAGTLAALSIDGVALSLNDRALIYRQTNPAHNGVYTVTTVGDGSTAWVLTRATDADSYGASDPDAFGEGDAFFVREGDTNAGDLYVMNTTGTITFGTTAITFEQIAATAVYTGGTGVTLNGTQINIGQSVATNANVTFNNISVTGTVDGRDVAADGTKLDTIEASADVTDTANVTAAGALMDSELTNIAAVKALNQGVATTNSPTFAGLTTTEHVSFGDGDKAIFGAGSDLQIYHDAGTGNSFIDEQGPGNLIVRGTQLQLKGSNGSDMADFTTAGAARLFYSNAAKLATTATGIDVTGNITASGTVDGRDVAADGTKLDGIEAGATADQTITAGAGLTGGGTGDVTISHADTSSQASVDNSGVTYIQDVTLDTYGHVTALTSGTVTLAGLGFTGETNATADQTITAGAGLTGGGTGDVTISHADTSSQASVNNSGATVIQDVTVDTYGHVTALGSTTLTASAVGAPSTDGTGASGTWGINVTGNSATTSQRNFSGDISTTGQGRFTGWYSGGAATGTAAEIGMSGGNGYVFVYNRDTDTYGTLNVSAAAANMAFSGSTINVSSGALQQGGNQVLHAGNYTSYAYPASNPNGYTTYSAGNGLGLSGTTFSVDSDLRGDVFYIGRDTNDYIGVETTQINFVLDGNTDMRLEDDGDLHVDGNIIAYSTTISDERLKTDIVKIDNALDKVCELGGYTFTYTADDKKSAGVIAQEVKKVLPSAIVESKLPLKMGDDDVTEYMTVQYDQLVGLLIEAVKELRAEVTELKGK